MLATITKKDILTVYKFI